MRPITNTVDYFPHSCVHKRTLYIIEEWFGNDGYTAWFKLLELLGSTEFHFINFNDADTWLYFLTRCRMDEDRMNAFLDLCARLNAIDVELWTGRRVVWSQNFVDRLTSLYTKRRRKPPVKPVFRVDNAVETVLVVPEITKEKERKEKESKGEESAPVGGTEYSWPVHLREVFEKGCAVFKQDHSVLQTEDRRMVLQTLISDRRIGVAGFLHACEVKARSPGQQSICWFLDNKFEAVNRVTALLAGGNGFVSADKQRNSVDGSGRDIQRVAAKYAGQH